jgi:transposase-like protein
MRTLESRISDGAMINTDRHRAYPEVLSKLEVAFHNAYSSSDHEKLGHINDLHSSIRGFMRKFKGVSTKWLHCYLAWFKWLREFGRSDTVKEEIAARQIGSGDYEHLWKDINRMSLPFRDIDLNAVKN